MPKAKWLLVVEAGFALWFVSVSLAFPADKWGIAFFTLRIPQVGDDNSTHLGLYYSHAVAGTPLAARG